MYRERSTKTEIRCYLCKKLTEMKKFFKLLFLICALFGTGVFAVSAQSNPFAWRANVKMSTATEGEIILKVTIADGWHLYGTQLPKGGPRPTVIDLSRSKGVKLIGKPVASAQPIVKQDKMFDLKLSYWTGSVTFRQRFKVTDNKTAHIDGTVNYMGCNDVTCSAPSVFTISKNIPAKK